MQPTTEQQCELAINQITKLIDRRQNVTSTYISVNTALTASIAFLLKDGHFAGAPQRWIALLLLVCGCFICALWRRLVLQYSQLLSWWYSELRAMEAEQVNPRKLFSREFDEFYDDQNSMRPLGSTQHELNLGWVFTTVYCASIAGIITVMVLKNTWFS